LQQPFELTVHSLSGTQLGDGTYRFSGDYLRDLKPSGTQYLFDWEFSTADDGSVLWNGHTYWAGGHIWDETISDTALVPEPGTPVLIWAATGLFCAFRLSQSSHIKITGANADGARPLPMRTDHGCCPLSCKYPSIMSTEKNSFAVCARSNHPTSAFAVAGTLSTLTLAFPDGTPPEIQEKVSHYLTHDLALIEGKFMSTHITQSFPVQRAD
jgi:hypothetical protein